MILVKFVNRSDQDYAPQYRFCTWLLDLIFDVVNLLDPHSRERLEFTSLEKTEI